MIKNRVRALKIVCVILLVATCRYLYVFVSQKDSLHSLSLAMLCITPVLFIALYLRKGRDDSASDGKNNIEVTTNHSFAILLFICAIVYALPLFHYDVKSEEWESPEATHKLVIMERRPHVDVFSSHSQFFIAIVKNGSSFDNSYSKNYNFRRAIKDMGAYIKNCNVLWLDNGCKFLEPDGCELFIPFEATTQ